MTATIDLDDLRRLIARGNECASRARKAYDWGRQMWTHEDMPASIRDAAEAAVEYRNELLQFSFKHPEVRS